MRANILTLLLLHSGMSKVNEPLDSSKLLVDVLRLNDCKTFEQVHARLHHLCRQLGFDSFLYGGRFSSGGGRQSERILSNYDESWRRQYDKSGYVRLDPTVAHAETSLQPLVWSDEMYVTAPQRDFRDAAQSCGLVSGVTFPIQSKDGEVALLSLALSASGPEARAHVREMLGWGSLVATLSHDVIRKLVKQEQVANRPKLTKREAEVLQWIAAGKSSWEISRLINISEHGVIYHVRNLLRKFDVTSRHQAVVKAIVLGLV